MSLIELNNVNKYYQSGEEKVAALRQIDLSVAAGEFVAVMGPSGSGKSTLLNVLGVLSHPSDGEMFVDEIAVYDLPSEKRADFRSLYIGFVFQSFHLIPYLTIVENVMLPMTIISGRKGDQKKAAGDVLERVGLGGKAHRLPNQLSGGEQERVAIARALVNDPPIILADEPTGNLDTATGNEVMKLLKELSSEGRTIIMVTHNPENAEFADRLIRLRDGRIDR
ncbi:MAG: ABC transporter ATP-binding protein [Syntrophales bacterium LBB04]|nr:ABC transporter ATP-binding protein [Syntrophales bacterium LBB04]